MSACLSDAVFTNIAVLSFPTRRSSDLLDQRADHPGQRLPTGCAEGADGDGDGELEVVARRGERQRGGSGVAEADALAEQEACEPHEREVDKQRQRDPRDIEGIMRDGFALEGE